MSNLQMHINYYLNYCRAQKCLDEKTIKAYRIDLRKFSEQISTAETAQIDPPMIENYIALLHRQYQPKTAKRKIASLKVFFRFLVYKNIISQNPFNQIQIHFREPVKLPRIIPLDTVETLLSTIYQQYKNGKTNYQRKKALLNAAVIELLFATGMRISEVCSLHRNNINLNTGTILIYGKGNKERRIQIGNKSVIDILKKYRADFHAEINQCTHFFVNTNGAPLSDQVVRRTLNKYASSASINMHITPHMFRHTFATSLLEADVDIRYIQEMLGHSSINITEIYTHVAVAKQREILITKHPRNNFNI